MKVTINTKNREYKEEYLKKETNLTDDDLNMLNASILTNTYAYVAYKIHDICGADKIHQLQMINSMTSAVTTFLDSINKAEAEN